MFVLVEEPTLGNWGTEVWDILTSGDCDTAGGRERVKSAKIQLGKERVKSTKIQAGEKGLKPYPLDVAAKIMCIGMHKAVKIEWAKRNFKAETKNFTLTHC